MYTYNTLTQMILNWCNRSSEDTEFYNQLPSFVNLTEQKIFIKCPTLGSVHYVTGTLNTGTSIIPKPASWGRSLMLFISPGVNTSAWIPVQHMTQEVGLQYQQAPSSQNTFYYSDFRYNSLSIFPALIEPYSFLYCYFEKVQPLTLQNQTNWNSLNAFDLLFEGCMEKAYLYLRDKEEVILWATLFKESLESYKAYDQLRLIDRYADLKSLIGN